MIGKDYASLVELEAAIAENKLSLEAMIKQSSDKTRGRIVMATVLDQSGSKISLVFTSHFRRPWKKDTNLVEVVVHYKNQGNKIIIPIVEVIILVNDSELADIPEEGRAPLGPYAKVRTQKNFGPFSSEFRDEMVKLFHVIPTFKKA